MAMCRAVWPGAQQTWHSGPPQGTAGMSQWWLQPRAGLAAEGFQGASKPSAIQARAGNSPRLARRSQRATGGLRQPNRAHSTATGHFILQVLFILSRVNNLTSWVIKSISHFCFTDQGGSDSRLEEMQEQNQKQEVSVLCVTGPEPFSFSCSSHRNPSLPL